MTPAEFAVAIRSAQTWEEGIDLYAIAMKAAAKRWAVLTIGEFRPHAPYQGCMYRYTVDDVLDSFNAWYEEIK